MLVPIKSQGGHVKTQIAGPHPRDSHSADRGCGLKFCISNKFSGDADATSPWTTLRVCEVLCKL